MYILWRLMDENRDTIGGVIGKSNIKIKKSSKIVIRSAEARSSKLDDIYAYIEGKASFVGMSNRVKRCLT